MNNNRTNEQIVEEALILQSGYLNPWNAARHAVDALRNAGRLAEPPSEGQLLAALNANLAVERKQARAPEVAYSRTLEDWSEQSKDRMRAALIAALAPVTEGGEQ